jgi:predicted nucleic acid-binding protein
MIVISDTTPILSLLKCSQLGLLKELYGSVIVPEAVYNELTMNPVFENEKTEILECPFIKVEKVCNQEAVLILRNVTGLDAGESEALILYG